MARAAHHKGWVLSRAMPALPLAATATAPTHHTAGGVAPVTHLLYLHGFRSSPQSMKALKMAEVVASRHPGAVFWCPQLPPSPREAMDMVAEQVRAWPLSDPDRPGQLAVMGSSLGGFYATWVAERLPQAGRAPVVLINPAVDPATHLARHIGEQTSWHDPQDRFYFRPGYVDELVTLQVGDLTQPSRYQVWAATGDEVLDWRDMQARYSACTATAGAAGAACVANGAGAVGVAEAAGAEDAVGTGLSASGGVRVVQGSDHALSDFDTHLPTMLAHLNLIK